MIIFSIRKPYLYDTPFRPIEEWVWLLNTSISPTYTEPTEYTTLGYVFEGYNTEPVIIGNVFIDAISYQEEDSISECRAEEKSYYYDAVGQLLYVHVDHTKRLDSSDIDTQALYGFSSESVFYDENNIEYLPYVAQNIKIRETADRLVYNKIAFSGQNLKLDNRNGEFDEFYDNPTPGSDVEYKFIKSDDVRKGLKTLTDIFVGYVYDDYLSRDSYGITVKDKREQLSQTWPTTTFELADYPDIDDKLVGDIIPDGFGSFPAYLPAICTNGATITGDIVYKYGNAGATSSSPTFQLYIDKLWTDITPTSYDYPNAEITVATGDGRDTNGVPYDARVKDINMREGLANAVTILKEIMELAGYPYTPEIWDTTKVDQEETSYLSWQVALYTNKEKPFFDYIEEIQGGGIYGFRLSYNANRKWTIQCDVLNRAVSAEYLYTDNINDIMATPRDLTEYATSVEVDYGYSPESKKWITAVDDSREVEIFNTYRVYQKIKYTSMLTDSTGADAKTDHIAEDYAIARGQISFTLDEIKPHMLYDVITVDTSVYRLGVKVREYLGVRKIKLSYIEYDFGEETTTLQGYDITEVV